MNIDEFVKDSAKLIRNDKEREQFEREMKNHILDRVEYYTDAGYDEETAIEKALGHMGESEDVSTQMGMVHKSFGGVVFDVAAIILTFANLILMGVVFFFFGRTTNLDCNFYNEFGSLIISQIALFAFCRKGRHYAVSCALFIYNVLYMLMHIFSGYFYSKKLLELWMIISGHSADISVLSNPWVKSESIPLAVATAVMYVLILLAELYALKNGRDLLLKPSRKTHKNLDVVFKGFVAVAFCFITIIPIYIRVSPSIPESDYMHITGMYIVESDEIVDFSELDYKRDGLYLRVDYDLFKEGPQYSEWRDIDLDGTCEFIEVEYCPTETSKLYYGKNTIKNNYSPSKRYIAVIPEEFDKAKYDFAKWFDTQETDVLEGVFDTGRYCESDYRIELVDDELFEYFKNEKIAEKQSWTDDMF